MGLAQFPHPTAKSPSMIGQFAPTFLFASIMFQVSCDGERRAAVTDLRKPWPRQKPAGAKEHQQQHRGMVRPARPAACPHRELYRSVRAGNHALRCPQFVLLVHDVVAEKEGRARQMMATMGLRWGRALGWQFA